MWIPGENHIHLTAEAAVDLLQEDGEVFSTPTRVMRSTCNVRTGPRTQLCPKKFVCGAGLSKLVKISTQLMAAMPHTEERCCQVKSLHLKLLGFRPLLLCLVGTFRV